jgi:hypothetical protein
MYQNCLRVVMENTKFAIRSPRRYGLDPWSVHSVSVVDKVTLGQVALPERRLSHVIIIPAVLHTHLFTYYRRCAHNLTRR